jgi:hypothetical protein
MYKQVTYDGAHSETDHIGLIIQCCDKVLPARLNWLILCIALCYDYAGMVRRIEYISCVCLGMYNPETISDTNCISA